MQTITRRMAIAVGALALAATTAQAQPPAPAREIIILSPGLTSTAGLRDLATAYEKETGIKVTVAGAGMPQMVATARTAEPPADVVILPIDLMDELQAAGGIVAGSRAPLGRIGVGLALKKGAPRPDISTAAKALAYLKTAGRVAYTDPKGGSAQAVLIANMLKRPDAAGINAIPFIGQPGGAQAAGAVARGEADVGLQPPGETMFFRPELDTAGPLPDELNLYADMAMAVSARSKQPAGAAQFAAYLRAPNALAVWRSKGMTPAR
jgi:ABC-type molybdate transport system substrate-binding protein